MEIRLLSLLEGAKRAEGTVIVIDVFRAFTLESYLFSQGAEKIYPVAELQEAFSLKAAHPEYILFGERGGAKVEGCDYGNAPSDIFGKDFSGRTLIHSTSAGTRGLAAAAENGAEALFTGALTNAEATARRVLALEPSLVSIVAMGKAGTAPAEEDELCARYLRALLKGEDFPIAEEAEKLAGTGGRHFFDETTQHIFPRADFPLCVAVNRFPFAIEAVTEEGGHLVTRRCG